MAGLNSWLFNNSRISRRLIFAIVLFSTLITVFTTALQLFFDYRRDILAIEKEISQIESVHLASLVDSLWYFDGAQIQIQIDGMARLASIEYVAVREADVVKWTAGSQISEKVISTEFPLIRRNKEIGGLRIVASLDSVYWRLVNKAFVIFATNALKTFLVAGFMLFLFQFVVTRHLIKIARFVYATTRNSVTEPLVLDRPKNPNRGPDELDDVASAIIQMTGDLKQQANVLQQAVADKTREMELMTGKLLRQEKLATIGQLTASIAHELRNPLAAINQAAYYIKRHTGSSSPRVRANLELIEKEIVAADRVISDLLEITHVKEPLCERVDLRELALEAASRCALGDKIQLNLEIDPEPLWLWVDPLQIRQVLMNLFINAAQACNDSGVITLTARYTNEQNERGDRQCDIGIKDNGSGVAAEMIDQVFEPLFTSKAKGTGLGLSICRQIIEKHGGSIVLTSSAGRGTTVQFCLPRQDNEVK